jgi:translation initiation factor 1
MAARDDRVVYSTAKGRIVPTPQTRRAPRGDGVVRVRRETQGRAGKAVTSISGIGASEDELKALAGELKRLCGCGGTVKEWVIEIQGDHRDKIVAALEQRGHTVKLARG